MNVSGCIEFELEEDLVLDFDDRFLEGEDLVLERFVPVVPYTRL